MATTKITNLTAYTDPVNTDVLPIVDVTSDVTKKVSIANVMKNASLGTAAAPGIAFDGDSNTGIYSPGADQVAISTGGSGRLFIDANGNVGLGTSSPTNFANYQTLAFSDTTGSFIDFKVNGTGTHAIVADSSQFLIKSISGLPVTFGTNDTERLRITSAGLVGVGTSSPQGLLDVRTDQTAATRIICNNQNAANGASTNFDYYYGPTRLGGLVHGFGASSAYFGIDTWNGSVATRRLTIDSAGLVGIGTSTFASGAGQGTGVTAQVNGSLYVYEGNNSGGHGGAIAFGVNAWSTYTPMAQIKGLLTNAPGSEQQGDLAFYTRPTGAAGQTLQERVRITEGGRVGIGTTSPAATLHLESSGGTQLRIKAGSTNDAQIDLIPGGQTNPFYIYCNSSRNLIFQDNATERARIDSSGRWLLGTSSASGVNSNTAPVLAGNFVSFTGSVSANHNTATTLFTLENLNATYMVTAIITGTANATAYHAVYIIGSVVTNSHSIQALKAGSLLTLSLSGANVQATQSSGIAQTVTWSVTRMANL